MKNLKLSTERPPQNVDALKRLRLPQYTLYVSKKSAVIALVDYKTSNMYGPQRFAFSEKVSKLIWEYIKGNKLLETDKTSGTLFGKSGMSTFGDRVVAVLYISPKKFIYFLKHPEDPDFRAFRLKIPSSATAKTTSL